MTGPLGKGERRLLILRERITDSTGLSLQKNRLRRQNASLFFDRHVLQHTESDQSKFCASKTLRWENIRKERSALQPLLLLGPALARPTRGRSKPSTWLPSCSLGASCHRPDSYCTLCSSLFQIATTRGAETNRLAHSGVALSSQ